MINNRRAPAFICERLRRILNARHLAYVFTAGAMDAALDAVGGLNQGG
jgi:hypothetical protein